MKRVVHRVHVDDTECNSGRGQKKKEEGSSRSYRPTFLPFGRVPGALSRLLFSPFPVPVIIVLTFVWLFPSCHAITCRELACCTLRIPRTCPRPTQRRASVLIWPQKNQWIRPFFFSFLSFFLVLPSTPVSSLFSFLRLSLSFIFFLPICLSIYLDSFPRLFASLFRGFFAWLVLVNELPYSFEHGQRLHEYASR